MGKLEGKVVVITGGSSGMALASAKLFVEEGAYVFITDRIRTCLAALSSRKLRPPSPTLRVFQRTSGSNALLRESASTALSEQNPSILTNFRCFPLALGREF
jgi:NAD(P)-dependent dehydrogenase (short-subunit alcohol dehydrogenase family)